MALTSVDLVFYYTGDATGVANANLSRGGGISASTIQSGLANNVFDDVTGDESSTGTIEYRAIALKDTHATHQLLNCSVWIDGYVRNGSGYDTISFALSNPTGTTIATIATEYTAPSTTSFTVPLGGPTTWTVEGAPSSTIGFGTLNFGSWFGIWLRRGVPASATAFSGRAVTIKVQGETTASPRTYHEWAFVMDWEQGIIDKLYTNRDAVSVKRMA